MAELQRHVLSGMYNASFELVSVVMCSEIFLGNGFFPEQRKRSTLASFGCSLSESVFFAHFLTLSTWHPSLFLCIFVEFSRLHYTNFKGAYRLLSHNVLVPSRKSLQGYIQQLCHICLVKFEHFILFMFTGLKNEA